MVLSMMWIRINYHSKSVRSWRLRMHVSKLTQYLMEPIMKVEVVTPEKNMGDVVADLNRRRGIMQGMDSRNGAEVVKANVPLSEMFGYVTALRTITSGRATSTMEFSHYAECPRNIADDVIAEAKGVTQA